MKPAFFTMDAESFYDTSCIKKRGITGDDSCAEQIGDYLTLLNAHGIKATLFVTADFIGECKSALLRAVREGHEIALHALTHEPVVSYSVERFEESIVRAKAIISDELGVSVKGYRAPCFAIDEKKTEILKKHGFSYDSSALDKKNVYGAGRLKLKSYEKINDTVCRDGDFFEVRPTTLSGGGYVRLLPWGCVRPKLERRIESADSYLFYVHPFELYGGEFSALPKLPFFERTFVNRGRKEYPRKIEYIIGLLKSKGFSFPTISDYLSGLDG